MAHVRQEVALGLAGGFGVQFGVAQRLLKALALGDVQDGAHQPRDLALGVAQHRLPVKALVQFAGASVGEAGLVGLHGTAGEQLLVLGVHGRSGLAWYQFKNGLADPLRARDAKQLFERLVKAQVATGLVLQINRRGRGFEQHLDKVQLLLELGLDRLAFRDVGADGDVLLGQAVASLQGDDGGVHPVFAALLVAVADFAMPYLALCQALPHGFEHGSGVPSRTDDAVVGAQQFFAAVAADLAKAVVRVADDTRQVGDADDGVLVEREFLVVQIAPPALALGHEFDQAPRERVQVVCSQRSQRGLAGWLHAVEHAAQRLQRALAGAQFGAQLPVQRVLAGEVPNRQHLTLHGTI